VKKNKIPEMTVDQLVERFAEIGVTQYSAEMGDDLRSVNRLFIEMHAVDKALRTRGTEARMALLRLYDHPNIQVRLQAAKCTVGIAPVAARKVIEAVSESGWFPQAGEAGITLRNLDEGIFKPD
jgi:hypothetical protein